MKTGSLYCSGSARKINLVDLKKIDKISISLEIPRSAPGHGDFCVKMNIACELKLR